MKLQIIRSLIFWLLLNGLNYSQNTFVKTFDDFSSYGNSSLIQIEDSSIIILGKKNNNLELLKVNNYGNIVWSKIICNIESQGAPPSIIKTLDNYFILSNDKSLFKTDIEGNIKWIRKYEKWGIWNLAPTLDSGCVITGPTTGNNLIFPYIMKVDKNGDSLWMQTYGTGYGYVVYNYIHATSDSGYIMTCNTSLYESDILIVKTNKIGDPIWTKRYGSPESKPGSVIETYNNKYFLTAEYTEKPCDYCELFGRAWVLKLDEQGDTIWTKKIPLGSSEYPSKGITTSDSAYILVGRKYLNDMYSYLFAAKIDEFGDTLWTYTFTNDSLSYTSGNDIGETFDRGFIIVGSQYSDFTDKTKMLLIKLNKDGNITDVDDNTKNIVPDKFELLQNYPNPFNPATSIKYSIPSLETLHATSVRLIVYDILGKEVAKLVNQKQKTGNYEVTFNANELSSGVYFYKLQSGDFVQTKKMILIK